MTPCDASHQKLQPGHETVSTYSLPRTHKDGSGLSSQGVSHCRNAGEVPAPTRRSWAASCVAPSRYHPRPARPATTTKTVREGSITTNNVIRTAIRVTQGHSASAVDCSAVFWPNVPASLAAALVAGGICKDQSQSLFIRHTRTGVRRQRSRRRAASAERA